MKVSALIGAAGAAGAVIALGQVSGGSPTGSDAPREILPGPAPMSEAEAARAAVAEAGGNPDVIVWEIYDTFNRGPSGGFRAYAIGTNSCNIGTAPLLWISSTNEHPVIGQNMFRVAPGANGHPRLEHIGQSWLKHGFCALSLNECGSCQSTPCSTLGVGCSDPYSASLNASQGGAGPKWQVNPTTGFFPYPPADPSYSGQIDRRLRVALDDVTSAQNPGARYFVEAQYVCPDDNPTVDLIRAANNVSYREANLSSTGSLVGYVGLTRQQQAAVYAWQEVDPEVTITWVQVPGEGSIYVGSRAYDNGDGTWDYEYAVQNLDVDRSVGRFSVPVASSVAVTSIGFHDVDYHSGDGIASVNFDGTDWPSTREGDGTVTWQTASTFEQDANANAIRWGTLYNFRFTADAGPAGDGEVELGFFKPGATASTTAAAAIPAAPAACPADIDGNGSVAFGDLTVILASWGVCSDCAADFDGNGSVDFADLTVLLASWGDCP